jgi:hypothetical protein
MLPCQVGHGGDAVEQDWMPPAWSGMAAALSFTVDAAGQVRHSGGAVRSGIAVMRTTR